MKKLIKSYIFATLIVILVFIFLTIFIAYIPKMTQAYIVLGLVMFLAISALAWFWRKDI